MSKSEKRTPQKSDQQRIWELEERLNHEQYEHQKTEFALQNLQEKVESFNNEAGESSSKDQLLEEQAEKIEKLEKQLHDLLRETSYGILQTYNNTSGFQSKFIKLKIDNDEVEGLKTNLEQQLNKINVKERSNKENLEKMEILKSENVSLKIELELRDANLSHVRAGENEQMDALFKTMSDKILDNGRTIDDLREECAKQDKAMGLLMEDLEMKNKEIEELNADREKTFSSLKKPDDKNLKELAYYKERLEEYQEEVKLLKCTKDKVVDCCYSLSRDYDSFIYSSTSRLEAQNSTENAEELKKTEELRKKMRDEYNWWRLYDFFNTRLTRAFDAIQGLNKHPDDSSFQTKGRILLREKALFDKKSENLKKEADGKEWFANEILLGELYFNKLKKLVEETKLVEEEEDQ